MADERTEKQKVQEITDKLEEGLKELFESEKYKTYLSTMSKFHNYSFNNTLAEVTEMLYSLGEISGTHIFIDGTKIESAANRYTFVWKPANKKSRLN